MMLTATELRSVCLPFFTVLALLFMIEPSKSAESFADPDFRLRIFGSECKKGLDELRAAIAKIGVNDGLQKLSCKSEAALHEEGLLQKFQYGSRIVKVKTHLKKEDKQRFVRGNEKVLTAYREGVKSMVEKIGKGDKDFVDVSGKKRELSFVAINDFNIMLALFAKAKYHLALLNSISIKN